MARKPSLLDDLFQATKAGVQGAASGGVTSAAVAGETLARASNLRLGTGFDEDATGIRSLAADLASAADASRARISASGQAAMAGTTPRGNLLRGELDLGPDPSLRGAALNVAQGLGSTVPNLAAGLLTRGRSLRTQATVGAVTGGAVGGGAAAQEEGNRIRSMDQAELAKLPAYLAAIGNRQSPEQARETVAKAAERGAFAATAPVSALGGAATSALIGKPVQAAIGAAVGGGRVAQGAVSGLASGLEESAQEVGEGVAQRAGASVATGETGRELGAESAANALLGAATGSATGAAVGAATATGSNPAPSGNSAPIPASAPGPSAPQAQQPAAPAVVNPARGVISRAVAKGAQAGAVGNVVVEDPVPAGFNAPPADMVPGAPPAPGQLQTAGIATTAPAPSPVTRALLERIQLPGPTGYAIAAPRRQEGESAKAYAKRAIDTLPDPEPRHLPQDPGAYFEVKKADLMVPLAQLAPGKGNSKPRDSANALKRMAAAADGALERRDPIDVRANDDGTYTVLDGNGTLGAATKLGFEALPVRIIEAPAGKESWRIERGFLDPEASQALTREYELATGEELGFRASVSDLAKTLGARTVFGKIKGRGRAEEKAALDYAGDVRKVNDLLRTTLEVDTLEQAEQALAAVGESFEVLKTKNALDPAVESPYAGGYRDAKLIVRTPGGARAEVQVNLKPMLEAKKQGHALYEEWRSLDAKITAENRAPTPEEWARLKELDAAQRAIYAPAWEAMTSSRKAASSTTTPFLAAESRENARGSALSSANTPPVSPSSNTGTPSTSKNLEPGGNLRTGESPVGSPDDSTGGTGEALPAGLNRRTPKETSASFGVIVAPKPGTKVTADGQTRPYQRGVDGANQPPASAPVQREPDLAALQERAQAIFKRPAATAALRKLFGVKSLKLETIRGSYEGEPELSFQLRADGLEGDNARQLAVFLGMAFSQDAVIVTKPDPVGEAEDSIPTLELYNTNDTKLSDQQFEQVTAELRAQGIDYSEARGGRAIRVLHFGDEAGLEALATQLAAAASAHGLALNHLHTRSDLYEAQDYRQHLEEGGDRAVPGQRPEVFRALVDQFLVPYTRAIAAAGYRFDPRRYADRYALDEAQLGYLTEKLRAFAPRPSTGVLTGAEPLPARTGRATNIDAAWFLQNRAAAFGEIKPDDRSPEALEALSETFAQEVEYQLSKPDGKSAIGWYDRQLKNAMATIAQVHPEIGSEENAGFVFKALLAVTSQGLTVEQNFNTALKAYRRYQETGQLDLAGVTLPGKAAPIAKKNVEKLGALVKAKGLDGARQWMRDTHTIRELKAHGFKDVTGRLDETVRGWHAFGPKIGSFGNNLDGDFDTLTADLWFSRTWNRALGTMFQYSPQREANSLREFRAAVVEALNTPGSNAVIDGLSDEDRARIGEVQADLELAKRLNLAFAAGRYKDRSPLNRAAKALTENATMLQDVPRGDPERRWQQQVMREVQAKLERRLDQHISIADLQALLWYQEKELFRILGAANKASAPLDYQDAAKAAIAQVEGRALGRRADATIIETAYPLGTDYLLGQLRRFIKDARITVLAGTDRAASRVAIDRPITLAEGVKLDKIAGIRNVMPGVYPAGTPEQAAKTPPRYQVPTSIARSRTFAALDEEQQGVVDGALEQLKRQGFPKAWLRNASFIFAHNSEQDFVARFYIDGETKGAISVRQDRFQFERLRKGTLARDLAHELAHAADFDGDVVGMRSATSPRLAFTRKADGSTDYTGDIVAELAQAHAALTPLTHELNYPFADPSEFDDDVFKAEVFAQAVMLYYTQRANLRRHAPKTAAMIEEMTREAAAGPEQAAGAVSRALRAGRVRPLDLRAAGVGSREAGRGVDRREQDRPEAGGRVDQPGDGEAGGVVLNQTPEFQRHRAGEASPGDGSGVAIESDAPHTRTAAFRRWFGKSKVVGPTGKPQIVYHGADTDEGMFEAFEIADDDGAFFAADRRHAEAFQGGDGEVVEAYLSLQNPLEIDQAELERRHGLLPEEEQDEVLPRMMIHDVIAEARAAGRDGVIVRGMADLDFGDDVFIAFRPEQIKSVENEGGFDPAKASFFGSRAPGEVPPAAFDGYTIPSWELGDHLSSEAGQRLDGYRGALRAGGDKLRTFLQDYFLPVRRVQEAITARGGQVTEDTDVYGREELYYGRTGEQLRQLEEEHVKPLVQAMHTSGVSQADLELYLYAKFAPARNARIAAINPAMPDGGSGMTDADAAQVLADFETAGQTRKLEALAKRVRAMNAVRLQVLEEGGLLSPGEAELWREEVDYVPLKGVAEGVGKPGSTRQPTGRGFSIGGREAHRALGRRSRATDLLANTIAQVEQAIIRAEKNRVATALLRLAEENPNPALWEVDKVVQTPYLTPSGEVSYRKDARQRLADNVVSVKIAGTEHHITLHDERLAAAMKNLGAAKTGAFLRAFSSVNRFLSLTRTMLAPEFVLANFSRDLQTASVNLTGEQSAGMAARVVADVPKAMRAMWGFNRGKSRGGEWSRWAQEFADEGGMTSFVAQYTVEEQQAKIEGLLKDARGGGVAALRKLARGALDFVEDANGAVENATRLAAYAAARRNGMSQTQAARLAKNLTVNFNRKGQAGPVLNALYLFYNASIQGTQRFLRAMRSPKVQGIMGATALLGFGLAQYNRAAGGEDDDGEDRWDKVPEWEKARNLIIFMPDGSGAMVKIPLPYTYNLPFLIGAEVEGMIYSKREASSAAANIAEALLTSFNPIGDLDLEGDSATALAKLVSPTAADPMIDIAVNRNFFGAPINPERSPFDKVAEPDSQLAYASVNPAARWLAQALNRATGGDAVRAGAIDVSPGSMVYIFDYLTGGTGSFVERTMAATLLAAQGEEVPANKVPFLRVFKGELSDRRVTDTFYRLRDDVNLKLELGKQAPAGGYTDPADRRDVVMGRRLERQLKAAERRLRRVRDRRKAAQQAGDEAAVKRWETQERAIQLKFNQAYFKAWEAAQD